MLTYIASRRPRFLRVMLASLALSPLAYGDEPRLNADTLSGLKMRSIGPAFMSGRIADIAVHPEDKSTWYVGFGDGIYRSRDGGTSWENLGLAASEYIARIIVHPSNSDVVYVAAKGPLWSSGGDRGLFMTEDGGVSWTNVLSAGPYTGVNDVVMHPDHPDVLYASTHQRTRTVAALINGGPETLTSPRTAASSGVS